ncbi:MAG: polymer-forming cytoskeletal protein [Thermodesulfobacteriota bacterium]
MSGKSLFTKSGPKPSSNPEEISGYFGKEVVFEGKMTFEGVFRLDGKFEGEIFESGTLVVGESAVVKGKVEAHTIVVNGRVEGEACAKERVEIHSTGRFNGNLLTPILTIEEGGFFDGHCKMEQKADKENGFGPLSQKPDQPLSS